MRHTSAIGISTSLPSRRERPRSVASTTTQPSPGMNCSTESAVASSAPKTRRTSARKASRPTCLPAKGREAASITVMSGAASLAMVSASPAAAAARKPRTRLSLASRSFCMAVLPG